MSDYINRDDALMAIRKKVAVFGEDSIPVLLSVLDVVSALPTVQKEVIKGKWERDTERSLDYGDVFSCSACGHFTRSQLVLGRWNYCPNCGADMREGKERG